MLLKLPTLQTCRQLSISLEITTFVLSSKVLDMIGLVDLLAVVACPYGLIDFGALK